MVYKYSKLDKVSNTSIARELLPFSPKYFLATVSNYMSNHLDRQRVSNSDQTVRGRANV